MSWRRTQDSTVTTLPPPQPEQEPGEPTPSPGGLTRGRTLAAVAIPLALAGGLAWVLASGGGGAGRTTTTSVAAPTTAATTVAPDPSRPPELRNTGEDFDAIVRSVRDFENWVYQYDPDPKWVPMFLDPRNEDEFGFEWAKKNLADLKAVGRHYYAPASKIHRVVLRDRVNENQVGLYVVHEALPANIVDRDGKVVVAQPTLGQTGYFEDWVRGEDGRWRLLHSAVLGPPGPQARR